MTTLHTVEALKTLGTNLAKAENAVFTAQAGIVSVIRTYAAKHEPLNAIALHNDVKKDMRAAIKSGIPAVGKSEGTLQTYATRYFRALVYASNKVCPDFKGSLDLYLKACADTVEGGLVWQVQERKTPEAGATTGKGAAKEAKEVKAPSMPVVLSHEQLVTELLRVAKLLGMEDDIKTIVLAHDVAAADGCEIEVVIVDEKPLHKDVAKIAAIAGIIKPLNKKQQAIQDAKRAMTA